MFRRSIHEAPRRALADRGETIELVDAASGSKLIDLHMNLLRPGTPPGAYHYHSSADDVYYVLRGLGRVVVEGREIQVSEGDAVFIEHGERHSIQNIGPDELVLLEVRSPASADLILAEEPRV